MHSSDRSEIEKDSSSLELEHLHPRLRAIRESLSHLLRVDDTTELLAALEDIQTLCDRCGYHFRGALIAHARKLEQPKRRGAKGRRRGRPKGAVNAAARQFGLGLALIWLEHGGQRPTRRIRVDTGKAYGPYRDFVALIVNALTDAPWFWRNDKLPEVDYLVRESVPALKAARQSPEEYRRRGLIDEASWLHDDEP